MLRYQLPHCLTVNFEFSPAPFHHNPHQFNPITHFKQAYLPDTHIENVLVIMNILSKFIFYFCELVFEDSYYAFKGIVLFSSGSLKFIELNLTINQKLEKLELLNYWERDPLSLAANTANLEEAGKFIHSNLIRHVNLQLKTILLEFYWTDLLK